MLTHINTYVIIPNKSTAISVKKRFCAVLFPAKIYRPATHPIILPSVSPDKILRLYCVGGIFFLGKPYLENFMSRPSVIPAFRPTPLQNRGRNFVRSKRRSTYTSSGTLYLFLRLNNSETFVELVGARPLHLLSQTVLPLKSPTGAFIAALRSKRGLCVLSAAVEGDKRPGKAPFAGVVFCLIRQPRQKASRLVLWGWHQPPLWRCFIFSCTPFFF